MNHLRLICALALACSLCACGGSGTGNLGGLLYNNQCNTGTQVQLVSPVPGQPASNVSQIMIVANGNSNTLYSSYSQWYLYVTDTNGNQVQGGPLNLADGRSQPHPYTSDFYYTSQLQETLPPGAAWNVFLTQNNGSCTPVPLQAFST